MAKYLDATGLGTLWSTAKSTFSAKSHYHNIIYERKDARSDSPTPSEAASVSGRGFYMDFVRDGGPSDQETYSAGFFINPWNHSGSDWSGGGVHEVRFNQNGKIYHRLGDGNGWRDWNTLAFMSNLTWSNVSSKPDTATRWPSWSEVTGKPSSFTPATHTHNYLKMQSKAENDCVPSEFDSMESFHVTSSSTGFSDGYITAWRWSSGGYVTQLYTEVDPNYALYYRYRDNQSNWGSWKRIPMGDGTGASGTWGIDISGNAATASSASSVAWSNVSGKPSSYTPATHYHDDRYLVRIFPEVSSGNTFNLAANHGNMKLIGLRNGYGQYYTGANSVGIDNRSVILHFTGYDGSSGHWTQLYLNTGTLKFRSEDHLDWYDVVHSGNIGSQSVNYASSAGSIAWSNVSDKPSTFTPSSHNHDGTYLKLSGGNLTGPITLVANGNNIASFQSAASIGVVSLKGNGTYGTRLDVNNLDNTETVICLDYTGYVTAKKFIKSGGTSSQFLKADGSVDSNTYSLSSHTHSYLPLSGGTMSGNITGSSGGGSWGYSTTLKASLYKPTPADSGSYFPVIGGASKDGAWSYGYIGSVNSSFFSWNKSDGTSNISIELRNTSGIIALTSDIPSTYSWSSITSKPDTATRWPAWSEVTGKPSTFSPSSHNHEYIVPTRHDTDAPTPKTKGQTLSFQFSYFDSDWWNVLNMRSYSDYNYLSSQILTPAGNPGSDTGYGDMYWREGRQSTWIAKRKVLDDVNSNVSGGGNSLGSSLTVKIGGTEKTLTIPSTVAWSSLTNVPSSFSPSSHTHTHIKGESGQLTKQAGDFTVYYAGHIAASTSGTPATSDNSNGVLTVNRHEGNYYSQIGFGSDGRIKYRSYSGQAIADNVTKSWNTLAYTSEIPTSMAWSSITGKPDSYTPSSHSHGYLVLTAKSEDECIPSVADSMQAFRCTSSTTGFNDGYILAARWSYGNYLTQLFADVDANYGLCYRYRTSGGEWGSWKTVAMTDGTGASGTWGINITGNAGSASNADTVDGKHYSDIILSNGKNLIREYDIPVVGITSYNVWANHELTEQMAYNDVFTVTIEYSTGSSDTKQWVGGWVNNGANNIFMIYTQAGEDHAVKSTTFTFTRSEHNNKITLYYGPSEYSGTITIYKVKVERGDHFTGWSAAPEDVILGYNSLSNTEIDNIIV